MEEAVVDFDVVISPTDGGAEGNVELGGTAFAVVDNLLHVISPISYQLYQHVFDVRLLDLAKLRSLFVNFYLRILKF